MATTVLPTPANLWRLSRWLHRHRLPLLARTVKFINFWMWRCLLPAEAQVGERVALRHHAFGVLIHANVRLGNDVTIYHNVSIAAETWIGSPHWVVIEDGVTIGTGPIVMPRANCGLRVGKSSVVGAGAVVVDDVPPNHIAVGVPARCLPRLTNEGGNGDGN